MFSFRTTRLEEQLDKSLMEGRVGCFCTQNSWDADKGRYLYDIFRERGNLARIFSPLDTELAPDTNHIGFSEEELELLSAFLERMLRRGQEELGNTDWQESVFTLQRKTESKK